MNVSGSKFVSGSRRRSFLKTIVSGLAGTPAIFAKALMGRARIEQCYRIRATAAAYKLSESELVHPVNGDELRYANGTASYSKGLPHDASGAPIGESYTKLVAALSEGTLEALESVPLGGDLRLSNPLAASAYNLEGLDSQQFMLPVAPLCESSQQASEMVELYWQAVVRDVPFARWEHDAAVNAAAKDLDANGFMAGNTPVTIQNVFRLPGKGVLKGPYVSQFLLLPVPNGNMSMDQRYLAATPGQCYGTNYAEWLAMQNGTSVLAQAKFEDHPRYISTPRSLSEYVHRDYTFQSYLGAALILSSFGREALNDSNPYKWSKTQAGFGTFGTPHVLDSIARVANAALREAGTII